jgi:hypothetical protein
MLLYGCETWCLTLREEHRLRVFENRVLRRIFGPKRDEMTGGWRKLHNEELHSLYKTNSVALARKRTMPTERPPLVGEVSANFCG